MAYTIVQETGGTAAGSSGILKRIRKTDSFLFDIKSHWPKIAICKLIFIELLPFEVQADDEMPVLHIVLKTFAEAECNFSFEDVVTWLILCLQLKIS